MRVRVRVGVRVRVRVRVTRLRMRVRVRVRVRVTRHTASLISRELGAGGGRLATPATSRESKGVPIADDLLKTYSLPTDVRTHVLPY
jgi:hypothetical protein